MMTFLIGTAIALGGSYAMWKILEDVRYTSRLSQLIAYEGTAVVLAVTWILYVNFR